MYNGDKFLLRTDINSSPADVAGLVSTSFSLSSEMVDVTTKESNGFTEKISGLMSASVSGNGIFTSVPSQQEIKTRALAGTTAPYTLINMESGESWTGDFLISSFEVTGDTSGAMQFSISLESTGQITFTSA